MKNSGLGRSDLKKRKGVSSGTLLGVTHKDALTNACGIKSAQFSNLGLNIRFYSNLVRILAGLGFCLFVVVCFWGECVGGWVGGGVGTAARRNLLRKHLNLQARRKC